MIDCEKCMYRKNGDCGYDKNGCGFVPKTGDLISREALKTIESIQSADFNSIETIREWIDNAPTVPATPISVIEQINAEIQDIKNSWNGREYLFAVNDGFDALFKVIEKNIKEYTE